MYPQRFPGQMTKATRYSARDTSLHSINIVLSGQGLPNETLDMYRSSIAIVFQNVTVFPTGVITP